MRQTLAIFVDSYRELNSKMMFWISLLISGLVVGAYACVGISERGFTVLWFEIPAFINSTIVPPTRFISGSSRTLAWTCGWGSGRWRWR